MKKKLNDMVPIYLSTIFITILLILMVFGIKRNLTMKNFEEKLNDLIHTINGIKNTLNKKDLIEFNNKVTALQKESIVLNDQFFIIIFQGVGTLGVIIGFFFTWRSQKKAEENATETQITTLLTEAIKNLGSENLPISMGGIYSLERIAHQSSEYKEMFLNILTGYIRDKSPVSQENQQQPRNLKADIQIALEVISNLNKEYTHNPKKQFDLSSTNLKEAKLADTYFQKFFFTNSVLDNADFVDAKLEGARFTNASLRGVDFREANLKGASFKNANLQDTKFTEADIENANFKDVQNVGIEEIIKAKNWEKIQGNPDLKHTLEQHFQPQTSTKPG